MVPEKGLIPLEGLGGGKEKRKVRRVHGFQGKAPTNKLPEQDEGTSGPGGWGAKNERVLPVKGQNEQKRKQTTGFSGVACRLSESPEKDQLRR